MGGRDLSGSVLDSRYRLLSLLGEGGMGQVYEGKHLLLGRRVAVKVLPEQLSEDARFRARFVREARAASKITHLNVVQVLDFGESPDGPAYIVMEFLEGRDLRNLLRKSGRLPWPRARHILLQAVSALKAAHAHDIIHRDIKPGNCFVVDLPHEDLTDVVKLLDFGIAKVLSEFESDGVALVKPLTGTGEIMGTASYMAPEQARGEPLDARSDIYSLGIMAYEMLAGRVPFAGTSPLDVISRHLHAQPPPLRRAAPEASPELEAIVLRALAKDPRDRFASMADLEAALLAIPGPVLPTVRSRVFSSSGARSGAAVQATSGPRADRAAEEMATEAEHQGVTPCFGPLEAPRRARQVDRRAPAAGVAGSDTTVAIEVAEALEPKPARARPSTDLQASHAITKVRRQTPPPVAEAVDPAAATAVDPGGPRRAAAAKEQGRPGRARPRPGRKRSQSSSENPARRSSGAVVLRSLGVVLVLGSGIALAGKAYLASKEGHPAPTSAKNAKSEMPDAFQASIAAAHIVDDVRPSAPTAETKIAEADHLPAAPIAAPLQVSPVQAGDDATRAAPPTESTAVAPPASTQLPQNNRDCTKIRARADEYYYKGNHGKFLSLTKRESSCWGPSLRDDYTLRRVEALYETDRHKECIEAGKQSKNPNVQKFVKWCHDDSRPRPSGDGL